MKKNIEKLKRPDWMQMWAGSWSLLSCSHFAIEYTRLIKYRGRPFMPETIIIVKRGKSQGWTRQSDRESFCSFSADEISKKPVQAKVISDGLKKQADRIRGFLNTNKHQELTYNMLQEYWQVLIDYYKLHINVKYIVDGLTPKQLEKHLPLFEDARTYAETVLNETEDYLEHKANEISKQTKLPAELILCLEFEELENYLKNSKLPNHALLKKRNKGYAVYANKKITQTFDGSDFKQVEKLLTESGSSDILKGTSAYPGKVKGRVKVVLSPSRAKDFKVGDILVAPMTRPEYLGLMKKASAFVTDSGGILSHAAIVARELKKPCVIGTKVASKVLKNGDEVEVDADKGIVRKI